MLFYELKAGKLEWFSGVPTKRLLLIIACLVLSPVFALEEITLPLGENVRYAQKTNALLLALDKAIDDKPDEYLFLVKASYKARFGLHNTTRHYRLIYDRRRHILMLLDRIRVPDGDDDLTWLAMFNIKPKDWSKGLPQRAESHEIYFASDGLLDSAKRTFSEALHTFAIEYPEHKDLLTWP